MAAMPAPAVGLAVLVLFAAALPALRADDLNSDAQALQALRSAVGRSALPSWNSTTPTCQWQGVTCENGRVVELRLPGAGLMGNLPSGALGNLSALRTLSLRYNALTGPLPDDLSRLSELRAIYFQHNSFSGEVPASLFGLKNLVRLDIADNKFTGEISPDFNKLIRLGTLYLDGNSFTGEIPKLDLPALEQFNVSYNQLNGSIPTKLRKMPKDSFLGNTGLCGGPLGLCPGETAPTPAGSPDSQPGAGGAADIGGGKKKKLSGGAIAGIAIGCVFGVLLLLALLFFLCRKKSSAARPAAAVEKGRDLGMEPLEVEPKGQNGSAAGAGGHNGAAAAVAVPAAAAAAAAAKTGGGSTGSKKLIFFGPMAAAPPFDLEDLLRASAEVLGKGAFGTAYKAVMENGSAVAVKRLKDVDLPEPEFRERIAAIGAVQHELVVPLRAYYFSKDEKLLVYDYMSMGSLSALLHGKNSPHPRPPFLPLLPDEFVTPRTVGGRVGSIISPGTAWQYSVTGKAKRKKKGPRARPARHEHEPSQSARTVSESQAEPTAWPPRPGRSRRRWRRGDGCGFARCGVPFAGSIPS
jgi:hypothetical protein